MKRANALQILNVVVAPIAAICVLHSTKSAALIIDAIGLSMIFFSLLFAAPLMPQIIKACSRNFRPQAAKLLQYSVPRLPSIFGFGGMLALGPVVASHRLPLGQVTYLLLGMSILMGISASVEPLGLILLSKVSMVVSENRAADLRLHLEYLEEAVVACYVFVCLQLMVFADILVKAWVGNHVNVDAGLGIIRLTLLSIPFYLLFSALRSVVDATSVTPYNMYNVLVSLALFAVFLGLSVRFSSSQTLLQNITLSIVAALAILACLTIRTLRKLYMLHTSWKRSAVAVLLGVALGFASYFIRQLIGPHITLLDAFFVELGISALFLCILRGIGSPWMPFFWNLALRRRPANA
jgi:O-antigen/teichoic acid export membrane protein